MPIQFFPENGIFKLDTPGSTAILQVFEENYLLGLYYGAPIPDINLTHFGFRDWFGSFHASNEKVKANFSPDIYPIEYSGFGTADYRKTAVAIRNADGNDATDFRYVSHTITPGKPALKGLPATYVENDADCTTLAITMEDKTTGIRAILSYTVFENESAMARNVQIINATEHPIDVEKVYSASVNIPHMNYDMVTLFGRWGSERNLQRIPLHHGQQSVSSTRGSSSHQYNPFAALLQHDGNEEYGDAYGFNLVYSGNFDITADCDFYETTRVNIGINPDGFLWHLEPGESFQTPEAVLVYSNQGLGEMSRTFHRLYMHNLIRGRFKTEKRPLLINAWEGCFFDFDTDKLISFAERAAEFGVEMLVMDDGWFGHRDLDNSSLGDWFVYKDKVDLGRLIKRVNELGLKFGIWFEPEMISPDSELYKAHPDWCLHVPNRDKAIARHQFVLDMTRADVRENIYGQMKAILDNYNIEYVKWDFNRNLSEAGSDLLSAEHGEEIYHRFVLGTYEMLERLHNDYPDLLLEGCSGGGGRFDPGMLYYAPQIWTSDNTDPVERIPIQFGTSLCYPASAMGAHVSKCPRTGYGPKGFIAMWGTFGYELDPNTLNEEERAIVKEQVADYHKYYDIIHYGDLYRIICPWDDANRSAWEMVSPDKREMLFTIVTMSRYRCKKNIIRFKGLEPTFYYRLEATGEVYSGALLMNAGLNISEYPSRTGDANRLHFVAVR